MSRKMIDKQICIAYDKNKRGAAEANGSPRLTVTYQKSNLTLGVAVAFLMFFICCILPDTDHGDDDADHSDQNADK